MGLTAYNFVNQQPLSSSFMSDAVGIQDGRIYTLSTQFNGSVCMLTLSLWGSAVPVSLPGVVDSNNIPSNFDMINNSEVTITEEGSFTYNVWAVGYNWVYLLVTDNSSGTNTGTLSATLNVKGP